MFKDFLNSMIWSSKFETIFDDLEDRFTKDHSAWVYVDGEEGDHGDITYWLDDQLVATNHIYGGDAENYEFTPLGISLIKKALLEVIDSL